MRFRPIALLLAVLILFSGCDAIKELAAFTQCKFRHTTLSEVTLCGVNVDKVQNFQSLNFGDAASVAANLLQGKMPLNFIVNVEVQNPNTQLAAMDRIDWIALLDGTQIAAGGLNQRIVVQPNNGTANMPISIGTDLMKTFSKSELERLKNLVFALKDGNGKPSSHIQLKIKPTITVQGHQIQFPSYITLSNNFTSAY